MAEREPHQRKMRACVGPIQEENMEAPISVLVHCGGIRKVELLAGRLEQIQSLLFTHSVGHVQTTLSQDTTEVEDLPERNPDEETGTVDETEELRAPYFPKLDKMYRSVIKPGGNMIRLKCNAEGNPEPNITWYKDWVPPVRQLGTFQYGRWSMVLEDIVTSDSGNYTCVVCNEYGCINFTYKVEVMERLPRKPYIEEGFPKNQTVLSGSNVQFECPTISDLEPFIQWKKVNFSDIIEKNSTEIPKGVVLQTNTMANVIPQLLEIKNVTKEDDGWYTCVAGNTLGWSQSTAYLRVVDSLDLEPTSEHQKSHPMLLSIFLGVLCIVLVLGSVVYTIAMIRRLKR
ncbi:hypothetical protein B566_EDAN018540 [Ephemera danica]|nr:hypothetical protein B566_EDAN018540 [Ephemera danica]